MNDIQLALMAGIDIPIEECSVVLHQPTIREIAYLGETDFFSGIQYVTIDKKNINQDKTVLNSTSNFQIFMTVMNEKEAKEIKGITKNFLKLIFPNYNVMFTPMSLILTQEKNTFTIDENNFESLQKIVKLVFCVKEQDPDKDFNPANKKAQEIAEKIKKGRKRVAELNGENNINIFSQYISSLSIGLHLPVSVLLDYTMYQLFDAIERFSLFTNWDIDIKSRLAGAKMEGKPDNWMKNIHKD